MPHEAGHESTQESEYVDPFGVAIGHEVFTSDGEHIGTVKELQPGYFKVDARLHPDFWLQSQFVRSSVQGRITMEFGKDDLGDYRVAHPADLLPESGVEGMPRTPESGPGENIAASTIREVERRQH